MNKDEESIVMFSDIIASKAWKETKAVLPLLMGRDDRGNEVVEDLASIPHLMIGGVMGLDKAMILHSFINGLILKRAPSQLHLLLVDFKDAEFDRYKSIPHLFSPIVSNTQDAVAQLRNVRKEMDKRYKSYLNVGVRNIREYNELQAASGKDQDPYVVVVIDEIADLMESSKKEFVSVVDGLSAMGRAAGIHLILATQRIESITRGLIANIPGRIAFKVASSAESEIILNGSGAENLSDVDNMIFQNRNKTPGLSPHHPPFSWAPLWGLSPNPKHHLRVSLLGPGPNPCRGQARILQCFYILFTMFLQLIFCFMP